MEALYNILVYFVDTIKERNGIDANIKDQDLLTKIN